MKSCLRLGFSHLIFTITLWHKWCNHCILQRAKLRLRHMSKLHKWLTVESDPRRSSLTAALVSDSISWTLTSCCCFRPCWRAMFCMNPPCPPGARHQTLFLSPPRASWTDFCRPLTQQLLFLPWALIFVAQPPVQGTFSIDVYRLSGWSSKHTPMPWRIFKRKCIFYLVANGRHLINIQIPSLFQSFYRSSSLLDLERLFLLATSTPSPFPPLSNTSMCSFFIFVSCVSLAEWALFLLFMFIC